MITPKRCLSPKSETKSSGYPTVITLMLFLGGLELLSLGIMGAYIGRNYIETKKRPIYVARERLSSKDKK